MTAESPYTPPPDRWRRAITLTTLAIGAAAALRVGACWPVVETRRYEPVPGSTGIYRPPADPTVGRVDAPRNAYRP